MKMWSYTAGGRSDLSVTLRENLIYIYIYIYKNMALLENITMVFEK